MSDAKPETPARPPAAWMRVVAAVVGVASAAAIAHAATRPGASVEQARRRVAAMPPEDRAELSRRAELFASLPAEDRREVVALAKSLAAETDATRRNRLLAAAEGFVSWRRGLSLTELERLDEADAAEKKRIVREAADRMTSAEPEPSRRRGLPPMPAEQVRRVAELLAAEAGRPSPEEANEDPAVVIAKVLGGVIAAADGGSADAQKRAVTDFLKPLEEEFVGFSQFGRLPDFAPPSVRRLLPAAMVFRALIDARDRMLPTLTLSESQLDAVFASVDSRTQDELLELPMAEFQSRLRELAIALQLSERMGVDRDTTLALQRLASETFEELRQEFLRRGRGGDRRPGERDGPPGGGRFGDRFGGRGDGPRGGPREGGGRPPEGR